MFVPHTNIRKAVSSSFRYLHDEVSGGVAAYSHLLTKSTYTGACVNLNTTGDYGYLDNIVDLSTIISENPSDRVLEIYYDQFENNNIIDGGGHFGRYDSTQEDFVVNSLSTTGAISGDLSTVTLSDGFTIAFIMDVQSTFNSFSYLIDLIGSTTFRAFFQSATEFRIGWGSNVASYSSVNVTGQKLFIISYDGSSGLSGIKLYLNDVITPIAQDSTTGSINNSWLLCSSRLTVGAASNGAGPVGQEGVWGDFHLWGRELNQSERETVKEILEQYYTFS